MSLVWRPPLPKRRRSTAVAIGKTLRLTEIRGSRSQPASAHAERKSAICSAWSWSNGTPVSSTSSVELIRFMPCAAPPSAVRRVPEPHQIRSARPGDCGWIGIGASKPVIAGSERATPAPAIAWRKIAEGRGVGAGGVGVGPALERDVAEGVRALQDRLGRAAADAELEAPVADEVG